MPSYISKLFLKVGTLGTPLCILPCKIFGKYYLENILSSENLKSYTQFKALAKGNIIFHLEKLPRVRVSPSPIRQCCFPLTKPRNKNYTLYNRILNFQKYSVFEMFLKLKPVCSQADLNFTPPNRPIP